MFSKGPQKDDPNPLGYGRPVDFQPVSEAEIAALTAATRSKHRFQGAWTISRDMDPVLLVTPSGPHVVAEANRARECGAVAWLWNMNASRYVSFTFMGKQGGFSRKPHQRIFLPSDNPAVQRIREIGYFYFALVGPSGRSNFFRIDFPRSPDAFGTYRALFDLPDEEPFLLANPDFRDAELDFWELMHWDKSNWRRDLSDEDKAQAEWADVFVFHRRAVAELLAQQIPDVPALQFYESTEAEDQVRNHHPSLSATIAALQAQPPSLFRAYRALHGALNDPVEMFGLLLDGRSSPSLLTGDAQFVLRELLGLCLLSPETTACGTRRPWLDGRSTGTGFAVRCWDVDLKLGSEWAQLVWMAMLDEREWIDAGHFLGSADCPMGTRRLSEACKTLKLHGGIDDAEVALQDTITEASEARQWTVPWGARVELGLGELKYVDIYELEGEFMCYFRDHAERYALVAVGLGGAVACAPPTIFQGDWDSKDSLTDSKERELCLALIAAAIVRDFVVIEDREAQFGTRVGTRRLRGKAEKVVVYLPRVRYQRVDVAGRGVGGDGAVARAPHEVHAHLRRADRPSAEQLFLANRYGFRVPRGYTFVRPHRRGTEAEMARIRVFRSRSASAMIFNKLDRAPEGTRPQWFEFEKDVARFLTARGFTVVNQSANRSRGGDGGVDIFVVDDKTKQGWIVQCKCWSEDRPVGPDVVRDLRGALTRCPEGTRGMIVTTGRFTDGALAIAGEFGFDTIDGAEFARAIRKQGPA